MNRSERRRRTANIVNRRKEVLNWSWFKDCYGPRPQSGVTYGEWKEDETWDEYRERILKAWLGRCRNLHPFDCGNSRCICGAAKRWAFGITRKEMKANLEFREQMEELNGWSGDCFT